MEAIKTILLPTDFSDYSALAKEYALNFAKQYKAKIVAIHVVELVADYVNFYVPDTHGAGTNLYEAMKKSARMKMESLFSLEEKKEVKIELVLREGKAFVEILEVARGTQADLIVISPKGKTGYEHTQFGSVTEKVVRKAPCSVFVAKKSS
jgi:nucleotide-binding universal stress UspA family protein